MKTAMNLIMLVFCLVFVSCSSLMTERQQDEYGNNMLLGGSGSEWAVRTDGTNFFYRGGTASNINLSVGGTLQDAVTKGGAVTSGVVAIDFDNARTNTFGGKLTILGESVQSGDFDTEASGEFSHAYGINAKASGRGSHAQGYDALASGEISHALGYLAQSTHFGSWTWQGAEDFFLFDAYESQGPGTFNINPIGGLSGFYIGTTNLQSLLDEAGGGTLQDAVTKGGEVTSGVVTIDNDNARTNTFGGKLTILGESVRSGFQTTASGTASHAQGFQTTASGAYSHAQGFQTTASGTASHAQGRETTASGDASHAAGYIAQSTHFGSWVWQGTEDFDEDPYGSQGPGTFNIKPVGGLSGFYIGTTNMQSLLDAKYDASNPSNYISDVVDIVTTNASFSATTNDLQSAFVVESSGSVTSSLPSHAASPLGACFTFVKTGTGTLAISADSGDRVADSGLGAGIYNNATNETWATITLLRVTTNQWVITGLSGTWTTTE